MIRSIVELLILSTLTFVSSQMILSNDCDHIPTHGRSRYNRESILKLETNIYDISISYSTGNIYIFASDPPTFYVIKKGERKVREILVRGTVQAVAARGTRGKVYIGCDDGLKIYDEVTETIQDVEYIRQNIWRLFLPMNAEELYAVMFSEDDVFKYVTSSFRGDSLNIKVSIGSHHGFVVDSEGNYFLNIFRNGRYYTQGIRKENTTDIIFNRYLENLVIDNQGRVYGIENGSLYRLLANTSTPQLVIKLGFGVRCMCFDEFNNLFVVQNDNTIVMLKHDYGYTSNFNMTNEIDYLWCKFNENLKIESETKHKNKAMNDIIYNITRKYEDLISNINNNITIEKDKCEKKSLKKVIALENDVVKL